MNEVATGYMNITKKPICGYIPAGTVNDFASSLKIPKIMKKAAQLITQGSVFRCDLGQFNDRYFTYVCGFGAFIGSIVPDTAGVEKCSWKSCLFYRGIKAYCRDQSTSYEDYL